MFLDLDDFEDVNDSRGPAAGDQLLRAVAERLRACVRGEDLIPRMGGDELAVVVDADLARRLQRQEDTAAVLDGVVETATAVVPGAEEGSINVVAERRTVESWAASGDLPRRVDALQTETRQGPCLDAVFEEEVVHVPDMAGEQRWPGFSHRAAEAGARSMLSLQLYVDGEDLGALNLNASTPHAFERESEQIGLPLAAQLVHSGDMTSPAR